MKPQLPDNENDRNRANAEGCSVCRELLANLGRFIEMIEAVRDSYRSEWLDTHAEVDYWVRNLERSDHSFWLPTSTDRFYPDFVVSLKDERILVVEYKGAIWRETPDSDEKEKIGQLWVARSRGRCLFLLVGKSDFEAKISEAILTGS